jgi:hypothetical protein
MTIYFPIFLGMTAIQLWSAGGSFPPFLPLRGTEDRTAARSAFSGFSAFSSFSWLSSSGPM